MFLYLQFEIETAIYCWFGGFAKQIGYTNAYIAELWGAYEGLRWMRTKGYMNVELQMNSLVVVVV
jgi:ribonuclease HI